MSEERSEEKKLKDKEKKEATENKRGIKEDESGRGGGAGEEKMGAWPHCRHKHTTFLMF